MTEKEIQDINECLERQKERTWREIGCIKILKHKKVFKPQMYFWNVEVLCEFCDKLKTIENEAKESEVVNG